MKRFIILFVITITLVSHSSAQGNTKKSIECSVEIMPNYMWHLFALSDLWNNGNSQYYKMFGSTVYQADINYLHNNRSLIAWGNGSTAALTEILFFRPFKNKISSSEYFDYLDCFSKALKNSQWKDFFTRYCPECNQQMTVPKKSDEEIKLFDNIVDIIKRNYSQYKKEVWPEVSQKLNQYGEKIDSYFKNKDIINLWEKELKIPYSREGFYPVLTLANAIDHLPSANNLSVSRNNFGVDIENIDWTIDLIVHEIGVFILFPILDNIQHDTELKTLFNNENNVIYQAFESYIEKKKEDITGKKVVWKGKMHNGATFNFPFFFEYYKKNDKLFDPEQLIRNAIKAYNEEYNNATK